MNFILEALNLYEQRVFRCASTSPVRLDHCTGESSLPSDGNFMRQLYYTACGQISASYLFFIQEFLISKEQSLF
jgi:hypothetical protein